MMVEQGFNPDKETKLIQVSSAIFRAVRIILDVKLSRGEMAFEEAVNMLVEEVGMSNESATAEVRRYTQTPGHQLSYLLGKHLILQLKQDVRKRKGDKFSEKSFHDTLIANGYLPFSLVRSIINQELAQTKS
jgi:uncharacterized protein (DUF885 family)